MESVRSNRSNFSQSSKSEFQVPANKNKRKLDEIYKKMPVLEEEEYLEKLEKVIKRDFYPELHKIEYLMNPEQKELDEKDKDLQLSLNRFIQRVKSEDNEILREIKEKEEKNWKQKLWWMFLAEKKEKELSNAIEAQRYYDPVKKIQHDDSRRLALPQFTGKNSLFFPGEGLKRQLKDQDEINKKKKIFYENTRLDYQQLLMQEQVQEKKKEKLHSLEVLNTPALIGLHKQLKEDDKNYDLNKLKNGSLSERSEISQINGYSLVEVPSYNPSKMQTPIVTWGEVEDTPLRLDNNQNQNQNLNQNQKQNEKGGGGYFRIQDDDERRSLVEKMQLSLVKNKKIQNQNEKKQQIATIMKSMTPGCNSVKSSLGNSLSSSKRSGQAQNVLKQLEKIKSKSRFQTPVSSSIMSTPKSQYR